MPGTTTAIAPRTTPYLPTRQEQRYLDLREAGHSISEAAEVAGVSADMVKRSFQKLRGLGVAIPEPGGSFWTEDKIASLRKLAGDGASASAAAEALGATRGGVLGKAKRLGIAFDPARTRSDGENHRAKKGQAKLKPAARPTKGAKPQAAVPAPPRVQIKAAPKPVPLEPAEAAPVSTAETPLGAITIHQLRDHRCHWPFGDPRDESFRYCGAPVAAATRDRGRFYCGGHMAAAGGTPAKGRGR